MSQDGDDALLAKRVLSWISYALRPMTIIEIQHATAVEDDTKAFDEEEVVDEETLISVCAGLVTIDQESNIIRLVHYTTQEWFERNRESLFKNGQIDITRTCLTYLSYDIFSPFDNSKTLSPKTLEEYLKMPLFDYAVRNWGFHAIGKPEHTLAIQILHFLGQKAILASYSHYAPGYDDEIFHLAPPICVSTFFGLSQIAMRLLSDKAHLEIRDEKGRTALHIASFYSQESIAQLLLEHGAETEAKDNKQKTPLHTASASGRESVVKLLLKLGAKTKVKDIYQNTPLLSAAEKGNLTVVQLLLEHGAETEAKDSSQYTPLHLAAINGDVTIAQLLLEHGAEIEAKSIKQYTPLHVASNVTVVQLLLEHGAETEAKNDIQRTPLHVAIIYGNVTVVQLLLEHGAEMEAKDIYQNTPLHLATAKMNMTVAQLPLEHGAKIEATDYSSETPLFAAVDEKQISIVRLLLGIGADVNVKNTHNTVLHSASSYDSPDLMELLLEHGAEIEAKDGDGDTPLLWAAVCGKIKTVTLLLRLGADPKAAGGSGTAMDWAIRMGHEDIVRILAPLTLDSGSMTLAEALQLKCHELVLGDVRFLGDIFQTSEIASLIEGLRSYFEPISRKLYGGRRRYYCLDYE